MKTEDLIYNKIRENKEQDNIIPLRVEIIDICDGSIPAAIMLTQIIYWTDRVAAKNCGWLWKSDREWFEETRLTTQNCRTARKKLAKLGLIETKKYIANGHNTYWYRPLTVEITEALYKTTVMTVESTKMIVEIEELKTEPTQSLPEITTETSFTEENSNTPPQEEHPSVGSFAPEENLKTSFKETDSFGSSLESEDLPLPSETVVSSVSTELPLEVVSSGVDTPSYTTESILKRIDRGLANGLDRKKKQELQQLRNAIAFVGGIDLEATNSRLISRYAL